MESPEVNVSELAAALRREKLLISSERALLQQLNESVAARTLELLQAGWLCSQQRYNLASLVAARCEAESVQACRRASLLESTTFTDAYKALRYKEALALGELLGWLRDSPHLMSLCLVLGEESLPSGLPAAITAGLYGGGRAPQDRARLLAVLRSLIKHQLAPSTDPRKLFRTGKCALARLFGVFRDGHTPARQFLVACLHAPVMALLQEDDFFLDIDPDKGLERFPAADRLKKFGQPNSTEYNAKVSRYRKWTVQSLVNLTNRFVASLRENWSSFPSAIAWIVQQVVHVLKQHSRVSERELHALCTDLVLTHFVCPAVVNPEAHGVVDVPVSYVARFNLIQVAQILQMLSLSKHQEVEWKVRDLYVRFERDCVWSLVEALTSQPAHCPDSTRAAAPAPLHASPRTEPLSHTSVALFTRQHLHLLIAYLKRISSKLNNNTPSLTSEECSSGSTRTSGSPYDAACGGARSEAGSSTSASDAGSSSVEEGYLAGLAALLQTLEPNYRSRLHDLLRKQPDFSGCVDPPAPLEVKEAPVENGHSSKKGLLAKVGKPRLPRSASATSALSAASGGSDERGPGGDGADDREHLEVLVIKLANVDEQDYVGMVPECKVLESYYGGADSADSEEPVPELANLPPVQKRTRFSVSHDEVSLGNTSDNLEAVSEAASNHSVTSSLELETEDQNDNLSDMVSANVSGRGSPNISGRETPSSQVTDGDGAAPGDMLTVRRLPLTAPAQQAVNVAQAKLLKQTRNEIEDKFCKFEIRKLVEGDETISIISDTWSTDVLASDSETIGDSCDHTQLASAQGAMLSANANAPDVSETASESAWSIDVLVSDSDRNTEVDTDDCVSVAARSDTSWPPRPHEDVAATSSRSHANHNGHTSHTEPGSPRHTSRPNIQQNRSGGYLSATAQLSRGGELDLSAPAPLPPSTFSATIDNRKSILVNGYPVMTCYTTSAPESPVATPASLPAAPHNHHNFQYPSTSNEAASESTVEGAAGNSDATSQWVDDSFPQPQHSPSVEEQAAFNLPSVPRVFDVEADMMDHSVNSSEYSFNASSSSHYDRARFENGEGPSEPRPEPSDSRSAITDLVTRMSSATISTSANLVNNITSRIAKSEIRTSIVSISSSRIERGKGSREGAGVVSDVSLSTLSVNSGETSASDRSSSQDVNSENVTERRVSPPPTRDKLHNISTGAIPKSISFDATAEKSQRCRRAGMSAEEAGGSGAVLATVGLDELKNNMKRSGGNLLNKIKMFRHKGRSATAPVHSSDIKLPEEEQRIDEGTLRENNGESSEDILARYRRKSSTDSTRTRRSSRRPSDPAPDPDLDCREGVVDLSNPEVFESVKRRLRLVLSSPDLLCAEYVPSRGTSASLVEWVRAACGAANAAGVAGRAGGEVAAAHAAEAVRALAAPGAGNMAAARLANALRADLVGRRPYAAYLTHCRAGLTHTLNLLERQVGVVRAECEWCSRGVGAVRVLEQLERGNALRRLARSHHAHMDQAVRLNGGELMDEKATRLTANIKAITAEVKADPSWEGSSSRILESVELTVERAAFARLYLHVMFPNGDGDIARDHVLSEHIRRLATSMTAATAGIAPRHLWAAPWPRAQLHLTHLSVFRAPRDKVACVMRCVTSIMAVLGLTDEGAAPAADDLTPVLVYVIIKVNPPSLLSTMQFVNALGGAALAGEALYWWTHFCAAVTYIKTMDYPRHSST